jgi:cation diffusion facilitator CzcD-associated flavoprotein CzcO
VPEADASFIRRPLQLQPSVGRCYPQKQISFVFGGAVIEGIDTVVVGSGQAGLAMSYHLKRLGREHVVLERGRVAQSWRSERWDSLMFQFPNWSIQLPGYNYETDDPDGYVPKNEIVRFIETYAALIDAPLRCDLRVVALHQNSASGRLNRRGRPARQAGRSFQSPG